MSRLPHALKPTLRRVGLAWALLLALLLTSLGSAYVPLGGFNPAIGLLIAAIKSAIVVVLFMRLGRGPALARLAAAVAVATLALLFTLSGVDFATRSSEPASMQQPQQLRPLRAGGSAR